MMRSIGWFAALSAAIVVLLTWVMTFVWPEPSARHAVLVSAAVALVVQWIAFIVVKLGAASNLMAAWGAGMLMRFITVVAYGLVAVRGLGLPSSPALISLVSFFFVTSLAEPLFLKP